MKKILGSLFITACLISFSRAQTNSSPFPTGLTNDIVTEANALIGTMPESSSWSNTAIKVDLAYSAIGIGQTGTAEAVLRGTYNLGSTNSIFGVGAEADFGSGNAVSSLYGVAELHKDLSSWAEIYAAGGGGYSWGQRSAQGFIGVGTRVIPIGSIPQAAIMTELDFMLNTANTSNSEQAPSTRILAGLTYHF
jgi:hypothetical protein